MLLPILTACNLIAPQGEPYYSGKAPTLSEVQGVYSDEEGTYEPGNLGGFEVTLNGSGFGDNADDIVVQFASQNADIVSVSDDALVVITPPGPITGGLVAVRVATATGHGSGHATT